MNTLAEPVETLVTADELLAFPSDLHYELIDGRLSPMAPTGDAHGVRTMSLSAYISIYVLNNDLGRCYAAETGFLVARNPDTVLAPDFAFVAKHRLPSSPSMKFVPLAPDLVLETRSPSDRPKAVAAKVARWQSFGVRLVLELDPSARILTVFQFDAEPRTLTLDDSLDGGDVLPGFTLPMRQLFRDV